MIDIASGLVYRGRVGGRPRTKGSLRGVCRKDRAHTVRQEESGRYTVAWKNSMINAISREIRLYVAGEAGLAFWVPCPLPVEVRAVYFFVRGDEPNGSLDWPTDIGVGDLDKLDRNLLDALTQSRLIADDSQVVRIVSEKRWAPEGMTASMQVHVLLAPAGGPGDPL